MTWRLLLAVLAMVTVVPIVDASTESTQPVHAKVRLISEKTGLVPGTTANLGLAFEIQERWHLYWNGRNDTGVPPTAEFELPPGFHTLPLKWPAPVRHVLPGDMLDHVYFDQVTLVVPIQVPADAKPGKSVTIKAHVQWLVCNTSCVAEEGDVAITLPIVASPNGLADTPDAGLLTRAIAALPQPLSSELKNISIVWTKDHVRIQASDSKETTFFPLEDCAELADPLHEATSNGDTLTMEVKPSAAQPALRGVLAVWKKDEKNPRYYLIDSKPTGKSDPGSGKSSPPNSRP